MLHVILLSQWNITTGCADLVEVGNEYFKEKIDLCLHFFRTVNPEKILDLLKDIGVFHKI